MDGAHCLRDDDRRRGADPRLRGLPSLDSGRREEPGRTSASGTSSDDMPPATFRISGTRVLRHQRSVLLHRHLAHGPPVGQLDG